MDLVCWRIKENQILHHHKYNESVDSHFVELVIIDELILTELVYPKSISEELDNAFFNICFALFDYFKLPWIVDKFDREYVLIVTREIDKLFICKLNDLDNWLKI